MFTHLGGCASTSVPRRYAELEAEATGRLESLQAEIDEMEEHAAARAREEAAKHAQAEAAKMDLASRLEVEQEALETLRREHDVLNADTAAKAECADAERASASERAQARADEHEISLRELTRALRASEGEAANARDATAACEERLVTANEELVEMGSLEEQLSTSEVPPPPRGCYHCAAPPTWPPSLCRATLSTTSRLTCSSIGVTVFRCATWR